LPRRVEVEVQNIMEQAFKQVVNRVPGRPLSVQVIPITVVRSMVPEQQLREQPVRRVKSLFIPMLMNARHRMAVVQRMHSAQTYGVVLRVPAIRDIRVMV